MSVFVAVPLVAAWNLRPVWALRGRSALCMVAGFLLFLTLPSVARAHGPNSVADIAESLQDAVVYISTSQTLKSDNGLPLPEIPKGSPLDEFMEDLFDEEERSQRNVSSLGSGFVVDESGIIVTNYHVIEGAEEIYANFNDGSELKVVKVLGRDQKTDLAVLKVEPVKPLKAVEFGDSTKLRVGEWVMAIGNPFGLGGSVSVGIISAKERDIRSGPYDDFIQTDAAINRGNSGGPLFDLSGKVIGVNTAIISPTGGSIGIGFAVPSSTARLVVEQLREYGKTRRGWLGVYIRSITYPIAKRYKLKSQKGALVANVEKGSPAEEARLKVGDVIVGFDGLDIPNRRALMRIVAATAIDKKVVVEYLRDGERKNAQVKIGLLPEDSAGDIIAKSKGGTSKDKVAGRSLRGLKLSALSDKLRKQFNISKTVRGVVITAVVPDSVAARKEVVPGDVIVQVANEDVKAPEDVERRIAEILKTKKKMKNILLLISDPKGAWRHVAVPLDSR